MEYRTGTQRNIAIFKNLIMKKDSTFSLPNLTKSSVFTDMQVYTQGMS